MSDYFGDIRLGDTIDIKFTTRQISGAPFTLAGSPVISAYPANSTTELTAGITLTVDFDSRTGYNNVRVVATGGNGYLTATNYDLCITTGTVNSVSVVGESIGSFSIENRSALMPVTVGRTAAVDASGRVLSDVDTIKTNPVVNAGTVTFPSNATLASTTNITAGTITTASNLTTNNDKTGYSLTQSFPANFASFAITAGGAVTAGTVSDKTGYSLSATGLDLVVMTDLSAPPAATAKIVDGISWTFMSVQNKRVTDSSGLTDTIANSAGTAVGTATVSDSGTVFTKNKYA